MDNHVGNELPLMLEGKKPLAMFYYSKAVGDRDIVPTQAFLPHVQSGLIKMEEFDVEDASDNALSTITYVLYAAAGEEWRIPAMKIALAAQRDNFHRPDEGIDRIIGMLLGYSKQSIDAFALRGIQAAVYSAVKLST